MCTSSFLDGGGVCRLASIGESFKTWHLRPSGVGFRSDNKSGLDCVVSCVRLVASKRTARMAVQTARGQREYDKSNQLNAPEFATMKIHWNIVHDVWVRHDQVSLGEMLNVREAKVCHNVYISSYWPSVVHPMSLVTVI